MKGERSTEELMGQIGGQEMNTKDEVKAMRELSERLDMSEAKSAEPTPVEREARRTAATSGEIEKLSADERKEAIGRALKHGSDPLQMYLAEQVRDQYQLEELGRKVVVEAGDPTIYGNPEIDALQQRAYRDQRQRVERERAQIEQGRTELAERIQQIA